CIQTVANSIDVAEGGKKLERSGKQASALKQIDQPHCAGLDKTIADRRRNNCAGIEQEFGTCKASEVLLAERVEAVAEGTGSHSQEPLVVFTSTVGLWRVPGCRLPGQQLRVFRQQLPQTFDVIIMNAASGFGYRPLESTAKPSLYFFNQVLPAWKPIFARQHQLGIALRQGQFGFGQFGSRPGDSICIAGSRTTRQFLRLLAQGIEGGTIRKF